MCESGKDNSMASPTCCDCGAPATYGVRCEECFFNTAIEGADYVLHEGRLFMLHS